ncbi:MAG: hypothetical protein AB7E72_05960 [Lysobacterales bacterium]
MQRLFALFLGFAVVGAGSAQWENDPPEVLLGAGEERSIEWLADSNSLPSLLQMQARQPGADGAPAQLQVFEQADGLVLLGSIWSPAQTTRRKWIWRLKLATMAEVQLPPIGWQRAEHPLRSARDCAGLGLDANALAYCPEWFAAQEQHRQQLLALFQRSYRVSAEGASQDSTAAFSQLALDQGVQELAAELPPGPTRLDDDQGQHFVWLIPWESLPALHELTLQTVHLRASVCEPDAGHCLPQIIGPGDLSLAHGQTITLVLPQALRMQITRCDLPERDAWEYPSLHRIPALDQGLRVISQRFHLSTPGGGYLDRPDPSRLSPELAWEEYSSLALADDQWICGPDMVYLLRGQAIAATRLDPSGNPSASVAGAESGPSGAFDELGYVPALGGPLAEQLAEPRRLDQHRRLLLQPYELRPAQSGEGQNGACDRVGFGAWIAHEQKGYLREALRLEGYGPDLCAGWGYVSIEMADDAGSVAVVRRQEMLSEADELEFAPDAATTDGPYEIAERYCLDRASDTYLLCDRQLLQP